MKLNNCLRVVALIIVGLATSVANSQSPNPGSKSVTFADCPVILENRYVVPARESGIVDSVAVELNAAVSRDQLLLSLEKDDAETKLQTTKENHALAVDLAADDGE